MAALVTHAPSGQWDGNELVLTGPKVTDKTFKEPILRHLSWPPDPNDYILRTMLDVLGWDISVKESEDSVIIRVNFGKTKI